MAISREYSITIIKQIDINYVMSLIIKRINAATIVMCCNNTGAFDTTIVIANRHYHCLNTNRA